MKEGIPSATAEAMAAARAFGTVAYRDAAIVDDPYAQYFLGPRFGRLFRLIRLGFGPFNRGLAALYDCRLPGAIGWVLTRHRYFDDAIDEAVAGGATQVVFVGAGYDSRALRQKALSKVKVFEVDHPATQARKKRILEQVLGVLPAQVTFMPLDATQGDLRQLPAHGFDRAARTLFAIEGVIWYLPPAVVGSLIDAIVEIAAPGSQVIFDYVLPSVIDGTCRLEGAPAHRKYCEKHGEPILWGIEPDQLAGYLREHQLRLIDDVGGDLLGARYAAASRRKIRVYRFLRIARAEVLPAAALPPEDRREEVV